MRGIITHITKPVTPVSAEAVTDKQLREELQKFYGPLLARYPDHPIFKDEHGTIRWKGDLLMCWLGDRQPPPFNDMIWDLEEGKLPIESVKKFYRDIGYSLSGYLEVFEDDGQ